uniref:Aminotransferase class I/classII large domain-containing protein n=1 Tax=Oncorhynchus mykiss TaxID=8022 RepID=A0A8C7TF97_ONCMY
MHCTTLGCICCVLIVCVFNLWAVGLSTSLWKDWRKLWGRPLNHHRYNCPLLCSCQGVNVRVMILVNSHNPLAEVHSPHDWHELHTIVDEVYMLTVYEETATFHSVLSMERTHVMWGIRLCDGWVCVGTVYSDNRDLVEALDKLWMFHGVPDPIQHQMASLTYLFSIVDWIDGIFLPFNKLRMQAAHRYMTEELQSLGVHYLHQPAGFYIWADLRKYLREPSFVEELSLWRCLLKSKVVLSCGQAFHCYTPGWFRHQYLMLGMQRIRKALEETDKATSTPDIGTTNEATEKEGTKMTSKRDTTGSHKAVAVKSTPLPKNNSSSEEPGEKDNPDPDTSHPTGSLDSLIDALRQQIRSSDWLEKNTPELSAGQEPELLDVFKGFFIYFDYFLHCRIIVKTSKL